MQSHDTIAAIATPPGRGGISVIRVSGPLASDIGHRLFRPAHASCAWQSHRLYHGDIVADDGNTILDEALITLMRKPRSFTGEDVLEISCHGNPLILESVLEQCMRLGCRPARPGEFSERAFLNGRMDLAQAEALAAMIAAPTPHALKIGLAHLKGLLGAEINALREPLIDTLARLEAAIDFTDDIDEEEIPPVVAQIYDTAARIQKLIDTHRRARLHTEGVQVVITGKPNVGKSSLLNVLAGKKKAIVTDIPGTTRDLITDTLVLEGLYIHLTDTAGIRRPQDIIEKEGIHLVRQHLEQADIIIVLLDGSRPLSDEDRLILEENKNRESKVILAVNKSDLPTAWRPDSLPDLTGPERRLYFLSAKYGNGLDELKQALLAYAGDCNPAEDGSMITSVRHKMALEKTLAALLAAQESLKAGHSPEFAAFEIREAIDALDEIPGRSVTEDVLSRIFSTFCVGK